MRACVVQLVHVCMHSHTADPYPRSYLRTYTTLYALMYVCMCVYVCACVYVCVCVCMYLSMCAVMQYACICVCIMYASMCRYVRGRGKEGKKNTGNDQEDDS